MMARKDYQRFAKELAVEVKLRGTYTPVIALCVGMSVGLALDKTFPNFDYEKFATFFKKELAR